jgi:hypothetical protein
VTDQYGFNKGQFFDYASQAGQPDADKNRTALYDLIENKTGALLNLKYSKFNYLKDDNLASGKRTVSQSVQPGNAALYAAQFKEFSDNAVDNDPNTTAGATGEYAWQLLVDLGQEREINRIRVTFKDVNFATEFFIGSYNAASTFKTLAYVRENSKLDHYFSFPSLNVQRFVVHAVKPDGAGQTGAQMGIVNFECFG